MVEKEIAHQIIIEEVKVKQPKVIVNGVAQDEVELPQTVILCPKCNRVIQAFQVGVPKVEIVKAIANDPNFSKTMGEKQKYCPSCGQALNYSIEIIEGEFKDVSEEHPEEVEAKEEA